MTGVWMGRTIVGSKEKIKVGGKEYESTWTAYKVKAKVGDLEIVSNAKVWLAKDVPASVAKMEMTSTVSGMKIQMTMEFSGSGNKK